MKQRIFAVILFAFALILFASCGREDENALVADANGGNGEPEQQQQDAQPEPEPDAEADEPDAPPPVVEPDVFGVHAPRDLGGATLRALSWFGGTISFTEASYREEPDPATSPNYLAYRMRWDNFHRVQEEFNFTHEEITLAIDDYMSVITASIISGAPIADVMRLGGGQVATSIFGDLIVPLSGINLPGSDLQGDQLFAHPMVQFQGDIWTMNDSRPDLFALTMGVNLDIINAIGAPNPVDLYNAGQWNWDAALNIMRLATADTTGDGITDRFGISGQPDDLFMNFIGANSGILVSEDLNYAFDHPNTIEALEFMDTIFSERLFCHDDGNFNPGDWGRNFWSAQGGHVALFNAVVWGLNGGDMPFEFAIVPWPAGPSNTTGATGMGGWREGVGIPHSTDWDPADILMVVEEFYAWSGGDMFLMHEDALNWPRSVFPTEEDVMRTIFVADNLSRDIGLVVDGYHHIFGTFADHFFHRTAGVMEVIEMYRGPQQEMLDNFFR